MKKSLFFVTTCAVILSATVRAKNSDSSNHWAGCYAIYILPGPLEAKGYRDIPLGFRLMTTQLDGRTVAVLASDFLSSDTWPISGWEPKPDSTVMVYWSTGFVGYEVLLKETGSRTTGTIEYSTDTDPAGSFPKLAIEARRLSCATGRRKNK